MDLAVSVEPVPELDSAAVVRLQGRLTKRDVGLFAAKLEATRDAGRARVIVDLDGVDYIDSTGLGAIVIEADACRDAGGDLAACNLQHAVVQMVELLGLSEILKVSTSFEQAIERVRPEAGASEPTDESITFSCPKCSSTLRGPSDAVGRLGRCSKCDALVEIPRP